ncbi:CRASP family complement regulator-acquiring lipoprotein (plasmid) [Borreliella finlandensis]|uniref:CRASP family complement regulator-acquiring lipoprotein n=1 Tax=Borreliella finlandensis TaxID=498741 RepID=UPI003AEFE1FD
MSFNKEDLSLILSKFKELLIFKEKWINTINYIINYCENNINLKNIKDDLGKTIELIEYINLNYGYFLKYEILKAETLSSEIAKILK